MLRNKDLYEEINQIEELAKKEGDNFKKALLKIGTLGLKLLHNIRTNLVSLMDKLGADKVTAQVAATAQTIITEKIIEKVPEKNDKKTGK